MSTELISNNYASTNVTTAAYVQLIAAITQPLGKIVVTDTSGKLVKLAYGGSLVAGVAATASLAVTTPIVFTSVAKGSARNTQTIQTIVNAATANPTNTILVTLAGSAAAITVTITPNDGTNNGAVPVNLTTAQLVTLINTGAVGGKNITLTDASSFRILQTATGGGAVNLAHTGEGDGVTATFSGGTNPSTSSQVDLCELPVSGTAIIEFPQANPIPVGSSLWLKAIDATANSGYVALTIL